jgi:hypothetical protein
MRVLAALPLATLWLSAADLPVSRVVLYKNGVGYYERTGPTKPGEPARLDFKASEMDDVLKSLIVETSPGAVARVRYDLNESLQRRLAEQGVNILPGQALVALLDQWRGARIELKHRGSPLAGSIVSGRLAPTPNQGQRQELSLLLDSGELTLINLDETTNLKPVDPTLQAQLREALGAYEQSRSREKRAVQIDIAGSGSQTVRARYLVPAPVWKSSYRLSLPAVGESSLEGWAIVDNNTGEDWTNVDLTVVSGRPVSFISRLYEPRYAERPVASLPDDQLAAPVVYEAAMQRVAPTEMEGVADASKEQKIMALSGGMAPGMGGGVGRRNRVMSAPPAPPPEPMMASRVTSTTEAREAGDLFEYRFSSPVTAKKGESLLLPFLQQKLPARRLLTYSDRSSPHPQSAAELTNSSGKTLDGGPITVYQEGAYAGEALMPVTKNGDKRLVSFATDFGTIVTTSLESGEQSVRSVKASRGVLTLRSAREERTTYSVKNLDAREKSLLIQHPVESQQKLLQPKADETTPSHYRFAVKLAPSGAGKVSVVEESEVQEVHAISNLPPESLHLYLQNKQLAPDARKQLEALSAKKRDIASTVATLQQLDTEINEVSRDQDRLRQNINALNRVAGQQEQVQRYVTELAKLDGAFVQLRDRQSELRKTKSQLESEIGMLIEKMEF